MSDSTQDALFNTPQRLCWGEEIMPSEEHEVAGCCTYLQPQLCSPLSVAACRVWDLDTGTLRQLLRGHMGPIWCMLYDPTSGRIASGSDDYTVR